MQHTFAKLISKSGGLFRYEIQFILHFHANSNRKSCIIANSIRITKRLSRIDVIAQWRCVRLPSEFTSHYQSETITCLSSSAYISSS